MEQILGTTVPVFIGLTLVVMGGAAFLAGQAVAANWRGPGQVVAYCTALAAADRFLVWSLFDGELLSVVGFVVAAVVLIAIGLVAFRLTRVARMVAQYPWLYERTGPFSYRTRPGADEREVATG